MTFASVYDIIKEKDDEMKKIFYIDGATTVCLLVESGEVLARGISIASRAEEVFDPSEGRKHALARAQEALGRQCDCSPILVNAPRAQGIFVDRVHMQLAVDRFGEYKGYYKPFVTDTELMILGNKWNSAK